MALDSYLGLIAGVQDFISRADIGTSKVDYFIDLTENWFNNNLRTHHMETTNGSFTHSSGSISHPADFLGWKRLSIVSNGKRTLLRPTTYEQSEVQDDGSTGPPRRYIVRAESTLLRPTPDSSSYTIDGTYYQKVPALGPSQTTNWVLTNYADAYLYGALAMSAAFMQDDPRVPMWTSMFQQATAGLKLTDQQKGFGQIGSLTLEGPVY